MLILYFGVITCILFFVEGAYKDTLYALLGLCVRSLSAGNRFPWLGIHFPEQGAGKTPWWHQSRGFERAYLYACATLP